MVEAITEDLDAKLEMWEALDPIVKQEALFATNTSSLAGDQPGRGHRAARSTSSACTSSTPCR